MPPNIICVSDQLCPQIASESKIHPLEFSAPFVPAAKSFSISENQTTSCSLFGKWNLINGSTPKLLKGCSRGVSWLWIGVIAIHEEGNNFLENLFSDVDCTMNTIARFRPIYVSSSDPTR